MVPECAPIRIPLEKAIHLMCLSLSVIPVLSSIDYVLQVLLIAVKVFRVKSGAAVDLPYWVTITNTHHAVIVCLLRWRLYIALYCAKIGKIGHKVTILTQMGISCILIRHGQRQILLEELIESRLRVKLSILNALSLHLFSLHILCLHILLCYLSLSLV